jgi:hypothetical protein
MSNETAVWISSAEALAIVVSRTCQEEAAKLALNAAADSGLLQARAAARVVEIDWGPIAPSLPQSSPKMGRSVRIFGSDKPATLRLKSSKKPSIHDPEPWKWDLGIFALVNSIPPVIKREKKTGQVMLPAANRLVLYGVEFLEQEVRAVAAKLPSGAPPRRGRTGPRNKRWNLAPALAELESMIWNGEMEATFGSYNDYGVKAAIERHLLRRLPVGDAEPSESTVERAATKIMAQWRAFSPIEPL